MCQTVFFRECFSAAESLFKACSPDVINMFVWKRYNIMIFKVFNDYENCDHP